MHTDVSVGPTSDAGSTLWPACLDILARELPEQQFNTWIKPLAAQLTPDHSRLTVYVVNRFKLDWVRAQYASRIAAILESLHDQPITLELALAPRTAAVKSTHSSALTSPSSAAIAPTAPDVPKKSAYASHEASPQGRCGRWGHCSSTKGSRNSRHKGIWAS